MLPVLLGITVGVRVAGVRDQRRRRGCSCSGRIARTSFGCATAKSIGSAKRGSGETAGRDAGDQPRHRARRPHRHEARLMRCAVDRCRRVGHGARRSARRQRTRDRPLGVRAGRRGVDQRTSREPALSERIAHLARRARDERSRRSARGAALVVYATPSHYLRRIARRRAPRSSARRHSRCRHEGHRAAERSALMTSVVDEEVPRPRGRRHLGTELRRRGRRASSDARSSPRRRDPTRRRAAQAALSSSYVSRLHARRRHRRRAWWRAQERHGRRDGHRRGRWPRLQLARRADHARACTR